MKISLFSIVFNVIETLPKDMFMLNILNMYDFVDEIIIVEGATKSRNHYYDGNATSFTSDGRSTDGTIDLLKELEKLEKVKVIYSEGFWDGKTSMCNAASNIATGDYIWQLDSDEFYKKEDIVKLKNILEIEKPDSIHFYANHFFGGYNSCIDEREPNEWGNGTPCCWMRIFRHVAGKSSWISHEPSRYLCDGLNCEYGKVVNRNMTLSMGIKLYHYSYVQYSQIIFKSLFYGNEKYHEYWNMSQKNIDLLIFGSQLRKFNGTHPDVIEKNYLK